MDCGSLLPLWGIRSLLRVVRSDDYYGTAGRRGLPDLFNEAADGAFFVIRLRLAARWFRPQLGAVWRLSLIHI